MCEAILSLFFSSSAKNSFFSETLRSGAIPQSTSMSQAWLRSRNVLVRPDEFCSPSAPHHFSSTVCEVITGPRSQGCLLARLGGCSVDHINVGRKVWGQKGSCITVGCSLESLAAPGLEGMWPFLLFLYPQHILYCDSRASGNVHLRLWQTTIRKIHLKKKKSYLFLLFYFSSTHPCFRALLQKNNLFSHFQFLWPFILSFFQLDSYQLCSVLSSKEHCEQPEGYYQS